MGRTISHSNHSPIVSVVIVTYNQEKYIAKAIEGVLSQKTNFSLELIISNDASTDHTTNIVSDLIKLHANGNLIKYIDHTENIGMMPNFVFALKQCKGAYIAMCDGDDYWTDPHKLQKQVDFLEANKDYAICFHRVNELKNDIEFSLSNLNSSQKEETFTIEDLAKGNFIHTPSVVFRNGLFDLPDWFAESPVGDYVLHMLNAVHGKIKYFPEVMAIYRVHDGGVWSKKGGYFKTSNWIKMLDFLINEFNGEKDVEIITKLFQQQSHLFGTLQRTYAKELSGFLNTKTYSYLQIVETSKIELEEARMSYQKLMLSSRELASKVKWKVLIKSILVKTKNSFIAEDKFTS